MTKDNQLDRTDALSSIQREPSGDELNEVLDTLNPYQRKIILQQIQSFSGPIPHPELLAGYERVQPGLAERIVSMAEKEQAAQLECDKAYVEGPIKATRRGQWMGFVIAILFALASTALGILGKTAVAITLGGGTLVTLVTIFVTNRPVRSEKKSLPREESRSDE